MPFLLLLVMTIACLPGNWPSAPEWLGALGSTLATWAGCAAMVGAAAVLAAIMKRRLLEQPEHRSSILRRYRAWRVYHLFTLLGFYLVCLYLLGWVHAVRSGEVTGLHSLPGEELLILAPFLGALVLSWALFYTVEKAAHE